MDSLRTEQEAGRHPPHPLCRLPLPRHQHPLPSQGSPGPIDSLQVGVAQVQLAAHQDDRCSGAEVLDFWVPHGLDMVEGVGVGNGEAQNHHVGSGGGRVRLQAKKASGRFPAPGTRENTHTHLHPLHYSPMSVVWICSHDLTQNV